MMSQGAIAGPPGARDDLQDLRIKAFPQAPVSASATNHVVLHKRWTRLELSGWP
jgi:hypothetical protein